MTGMVIEGVPCAKGWVCYCLDEISRGRGAHGRLRKLSDAIAALPENRGGLEQVFGEYLLSYCISDASARQKVVARLGRFWFDAKSPEAFFPGIPVAEIYAEGVLKALELSLNGRRTVPIEAWWILDCSAVKMLSLANVDERGVTIGGVVSLLVATPRPRRHEKPRGPAILGDIAQAWVSEQLGKRVATLRVRDIK